MLLLDETSTKKNLLLLTIQNQEKNKAFFGAVPKDLRSYEPAKDDLRIIKKKSENVCLVC